MQDAIAKMSGMSTMRVRRMGLWLALALLGSTSALAYRNAGFAPLDPAGSASLIVKAQVVCRTWTEGTKKFTEFCKEGYACGPGSKCIPGPELKRKADDQARRLQELKDSARSVSRAARTAERRADQARKSPSRDGRVLTPSGGDPKRLQASCSTITGLPGPAGAQPPCASTGKVNRFARPADGQGARPTAANSRSLGDKILRGQPPGTRWVLANADDDDPLAPWRKSASEKLPAQGGADAPDIHGSRSSKPAELQPDEICEMQCGKRGGLVIEPNKGAEEGSCGSAGGTPTSDNPDPTDKNFVRWKSTAVRPWPAPTQWCYGTRDGTKAFKIKDESLPEKLCELEHEYKKVVKESDQKCAIR